MLRFIPFRCKFGQPKKGVEAGPQAILRHLRARMPVHAVPSIGITSCADYAKGAWANRVDRTNRAFVNVNLGGDHSISACTIQPYINYYGEDLLVLWIDAHADVNTYTASLTKNRHGMPVASLLGLMPPWYTSSKPRQNLSPRNLIYYGLRDVDPFEAQVLTRYCISVWPKFDPGLLAALQRHPAKFIYISCDIDGLDPSVMPSTGTPVPGGLSLDDVISVIQGTRKRLIGMDLVEFNPFIGRPDEVQKTLAGITAIVQAVKPVQRALSR